MTELTDKQRAFITEYLQSLNATQAAKRAGYSEKSARQIGSENLAKPDIQAVVEQFLSENAMPAAEVLFHLSEVARGDVIDLLDDNGAVDIAKAKANGKVRLIKKYKKRTRTRGKITIVTTEVEMVDRLQALEMLCQYHYGVKLKL